MDMAEKRKESRKLYGKGFGRIEIAERLGVTRQTATVWTSDLKNPIRKCEECGDKFRPPRSNAVFCSDICSNRSFRIRKKIENRKYGRRNKCLTCGKSFKANKPSQFTCSHRCTMIQWHKQRKIDLRKGEHK